MFLFFPNCPCRTIFSYIQLFKHVEC
uniref:Uncharacterized protein n=1 Tax=Arundo donax TaxID=35708 RepID=A0A0A9GXW7_ARUDO